MSAATQSELRLARLIDERELIRSKHENKLAEIEGRDDKTLTDSDAENIKIYREQASNLDIEVADLAKEIEAANRSTEESKKIRRALAGSPDGVEEGDDGVVYRDMATYARDVLLTRSTQVGSSIQQRLGDKQEIQKAKERLQLLERTPESTLSSDVGGLIPPQHIAQIFQVIDTSRPIVASAQRAVLDRGTLTYPRVDQRPEVAVQNTEKQEAGDQKMEISMQTATASVYLGGGDLSWQAINWSTPNALDLWFQLAAAEYALKTESDAAQVISHSAFLNNISSPIDTTPSFAEFMTALGAGGAEVYKNSGRQANTVYMAIDAFWYVFGTTSDSTAQFTTVSGGGVGPLRFVASRGLDTNVIIVGDSAGLLVAETGGAPVELRVTEPAIGGVEVGIIGAFEAVVVDDGAFSMITTAS